MISKRVSSLEGLFKLLSSDYSLHFTPLLHLYVHKCKFLSFYKVDSFIMLLFSHLSSCLVHLFVFECADWATGVNKVERWYLNSFWYFRQYNWKDQNLHHEDACFFHMQTLCPPSRNLLNSDESLQYFHSSIVLNLFNRGHVFQSESICGSPPFEMKADRRHLPCF